jgi:plexin A
LFAPFYRDFLGGRKYLISLVFRERYPINYIYGFSSEGFSYFLTTQMKQTSPSPYDSKIVRVCHDDSDYYSYTEV